MSNWKIWTMVGAFALCSFWALRPRLTISTAAGEPTSLIRVTHTLTDDGVRRALDAAAARYGKLHPDRRVVIQAVPARSYDQWTNTQAIGGTLPDIIQVTGVAGRWSLYAQRYLLPLGPDAVKPNPYEPASGSAAVPWRETFRDGLSTGYFLHLMEYFRIPVALNTTRVFFNRSLYREIMGSAPYPRDLSQYLAFAERVRRVTRDREKALHPMVVSGEHMVRNGARSFVFGQIVEPAAMNLAERYEIAFWGIQQHMLPHYGLLTGSFSFNNPTHERALGLLRAFAATCQPGFSSYQNEDSRMLFLQGRAVATIGDTWDLGIMKRLADFEIDVVPFFRVVLEVDGKPVVLPKAREEVTEGLSLSFGINRESPRARLALDFLHFLSSREENARVCQSLNWISAVSENPPGESLATFEPVTSGPIGYMAFSQPPGRTHLYLVQNLPIFLNGAMDFKALASGVDSTWLQQGDRDIQAFNLRLMRGTRVIENNIAKERAAELFPEARVSGNGDGGARESSYTFGLEMLDLLHSHATERSVVRDWLAAGDYVFPPKINEPLSGKNLIRLIPE